MLAGRAQCLLARLLVIFRPDAMAPVDFFDSALSGDAVFKG